MTQTADRFYKSLVVLGDDDPDGILRAFVDGLLDQTDSVVQVISDTDAGPGWSALVDVDRCPSWALRWCGQLVGVRIPEGLDDDTARQMIRDEAGFARGTLAAVKAAAMRVMRPGFEPVIVERVPNAYHLQVTVYSSWLTGATYRELSAEFATYPDLETEYPTYDVMTGRGTQAVTDALLAAKPAGLLMDITVASSPTYAFLTAGWATYPDLEAAFPTYDVMTNAIA